jgi:hypothetical protein
VAELELYRPGAEAERAGPPAADIAGRMDPGGVREVVGEGIIDSKFGPVALMGFADRLKDNKRCLGFMKTLEVANLRISGWSCQGEGLPARRAAIACTLNRLVLLTAGNEPRLQEAFAQADLKRADCISGAALSTISADWVTGAQNPLLRGSLRPLRDGQDQGLGLHATFGHTAHYIDDCGRIDLVAGYLGQLN